MSDTTFHFAASGPLWRRLAGLVQDTVRGATTNEPHHALDELPDHLLADIGIERGEINGIADALVSGCQDMTLAAQGRVTCNATARRNAPWMLPRALARAAVVALALVSAFAILSRSVLADAATDNHLKRGQYLVKLGGCNDCHTPGYFFGKPDMTRFLGGSEVGFEIPGLGVFHGPNLTRDEETGLGRWSSDEIATAITTGQRPDGRILAPIMPWHAFAAMTRDDVQAMAAYLKSLPPVKNKVPGPFGPTEQPTSFVMKIVAPAPAGEQAPN